MSAAPVRLLLSPPRAGVDNMALDDALLRRAARTRETVVRVYGWSRPTLSLGRNQRAVGVYDPERLAERGIDLVRRPTGGRAVLHSREVTYSVTAPLGSLAPADAPLSAGYARINAVLLAALRALGVPVREATPQGRAPAPDGTPCFEVPTGGELVVDVAGATRKLVGSAQWRDEAALLQHGSILVDDDQQTVGELATRPLQPIPAPATLRELLGRAPALDQVAAALFAAVRRELDPDARPLGDDPALALDAATRRAHYLDAAWTWRR